MASFQTQRFLKDIKHVDKDLRLMALFDLRRYVPNAVPDSIPPEVVEKTLLCLSPDERCEEVQNEAANVLPSMVVKCQERESILQALLSGITTTAPSTDNEEVNLRYLCGMAFKRCCAEFAEEARRNVTFWQKQIRVARELCRSCAAHLESPQLDESTREIMYSALNALVPAYRDALDGRAALILRAVLDFQTTISLRHASLTLVESLMAFVDVATQVQVLAESAKLLLSSMSGEQYVAYLQLCEAELTTLRTPSLVVVQEVIDSVCCRLRLVAEQYAEGDEDSSEMLLEVMDSLLQLKPSDGTLQWSGVLAAIKDLVSFDPFNNSAEVEPAANDDYDDEYDAYYDYGHEAADSTWKLRMRAVRVVQTLVAQHGDAALGVDTLTLLAGALQDRVQVVQLEALKLFRIIVRRSYAREPACADLIVARSEELCDLLCQSDDKATPAAVRALEEVFEVFVSVESFRENLLPRLVAQIHANPTYFASTTATVDGLRNIVAMVVRVAAGQKVSAAAIDLGKELPALGASASIVEAGGGAAAAAAEIRSVSRTLLDLHTATRDASTPAAVNAAYGALVANAAAPIVCREAAAESVASWVGVCGVQSLASAATALWHALGNDAMRLPVLRALAVLTRSETAAAAVPSAVLHTTESLLESPQQSVRLAAAEALLGFLSTPAASSLNAPDVQRLTQRFASRQSLSLASCEVAELRPFALLLRRLFQLANSNAAGFYKTYVASAWERLTLIATAVGFSQSLLGPALSAVADLLAAVYARDAAERAAMEFDVASFLTRHQAHMACVATLVRCVGSDAMNGFLGKISDGIGGKGYILLCVGEAGRTAALEKQWTTLLLDSVQSKQGEAFRTCGEFALSCTMLNPANAATVLLPCGARAADQSTVGRYYYVKAIKDAATLALSRHATAFHNTALSGTLLATFLGAPAGADFEELYGACVGILSAFMLGSGRPLLIADALFNDDASLDTRATCMVAVRYFLGALAERAIDSEPFRDVAIRALLQLKRPTEAKEGTAPSLPLRSMALRLLISVLQHHPQWLVCEEMQTSIFPNLLAELREDGTLQGTIDLSGYMHRVDKGLECRKLAFESLSTVFWAARQHNVDLLTFCNARSAVVDTLIVACSPFSKGDRDPSVNETAKELLLRFMESNPRYAFTAEQLDALIEKLTHDIKASVNLSNDAQKTALLYTIKCVMRLSSYPAFAYHRGFQEVAEVARGSALLAQSLRV